MQQPLHFLMVTIEGGGNLPPVLGLARRLVEKGHRVRVLTEPCLEGAVVKTGASFLPFTEYFTKTDRLEDMFKDAGTSPLTNPAMDNVIFGPSEITVQQTMAALREQPTDVLLADVLLPASIIAAEAVGIPSVLLFHMPEYMPGPNRPPGMLGLVPGKTWFGKTRNRWLSKVFALGLRKYLPMLNRIRKKHGLIPLKQVGDLLDMADLRLIQTVRSFDFPIEPAPANVRYTGPVLDDPDWLEGWDNPWGEEDERPLVAISLSTTFQDQRQALQNAVDALETLPVRGLVTTGPAVRPEEIHAPANVVVLSAAPHSQIFPMTQLVITHAGHGTVMRALSHGVPLVCLPMGRDQNDNAAKVAYRGCGIQLSAKASPSTIRTSVEKILANPEFRDNARRMQQEILAASDQTDTIWMLEELSLRISRKGAMNYD